MFRNKKIAVCLPARNESGHLEKIAKTMPKCVDEIVVVSNRSFDTTISELQDINIKRLKLVVDDRTIDGIGYGFAHMAAMENTDADILISADADMTYPVEDIEEIVTYFVDNNYDFITCTRYPVDKQTKIPFKLQLGVNVLNWETRLLYGFAAQDILSGMWVLTKDASQKLDLRMGGWNLSPEIKIKAFQHPLIRYGEYHIRQKTRAGETKQNYFKTGFDHLLWILLNRFGLGYPKNMDIVYSPIQNRWSKQSLTQK